jgi:hypothetical protein
MEANGETYRLYSCARCAEQVRICRDCDRGNRHCAGECARVCRGESLLRAGERYQRSYRGACRHAARQSAWRTRQSQKVTHQGSLAVALTGTVALLSIPIEPRDAEDITVVEPPSAPDGCAALDRTDMQRGVHPHAHRRMALLGRCNFCERALPHFARHGPLRGGP